MSSVVVVTTEVGEQEREALAVHAPRRAMPKRDVPSRSLPASAGLLNCVGGLHSKWDRPRREPEIMAVRLRGRLVSRRLGTAARPADQGHHPGAPPEGSLEFQVGDLECTFQGVRKVPAAMPLDGVELREQVGPGRHTDHHESARACQLAEPATAARSSSRCSITSSARTAS